MPLERGRWDAGNGPGKCSPSTTSGTKRAPVGWIQGSLKPFPELPGWHGWWAVSLSLVVL